MREIQLLENLTADVEGQIEEVDDVLKITKIRLHYHILVTAGTNLEKIDRALSSYSDKCPAYQSVKGCIECSWDAEIKEG